MSFSKRFTGVAAAIVTAMATFPDEQRKLDTAHLEALGQGSSGIAEGHAKQIEVATAEARLALNTLPTDVEFFVDIWGHANADESGSFGWKLSTASDRPTPQPG